MKTSLLFFLIIITFCSFTLSKINEPEDSYVGLWTVHWANDSPEDVPAIEYVDTFKIELNHKGKLSISCINYEYFVFSKIKPNESSLNFQVENIEVPNEKFFIKYTLQRENENLLKGQILNSKGQRDHIMLKKLK